jgi:hypothetical protein
MSRCDFGGMIILPAKITSTHFEKMLNWQQNCFARDNTYIHMIKHCWVCRLRYMSRCHFGGPKNTNGKNVFRFMKSKELMARADSKPDGTHSKLAGTHFTIGKIKFR